jgi:mRNA interferase RelE/StbE
VPIYSRRAQKDLAQLPEAVQAKARALIEQLDSNPALGKKLLGPLKGIRSARLGRSYRVLYEVHETAGVKVLTISMRRDAYR